MRILHIAPHLGGGVGKAHAALGQALPKQIERTFCLLEEPRDRRYVGAIEARGANVIVAAGLDGVAELAAAADIVQFEFWNHPRLFECLACTRFPSMRTVFWSHISGLSKPVIQPRLMAEAGRFVFSTEASRSLVASLPQNALGKIAVINSGFGFADTVKRASARGRKPAVAYLGTVDFVKMHPGFFEAIDALQGDDLKVLVWGSVEPAGAVAERARAMRHPDRVQFGGHALDPAVALAGADIFFYPLRPDHYGTAENALVEAMSLGLVPAVMNNPAEMAIVRHDETGFVARSIEECAAYLQMLLSSPSTLDRVSRNAARHIAETRTPARSAQEFMQLWLGLLAGPKCRCDFRAAIGDDPAQWFLATQRLPGETCSETWSDNTRQHRATAEAVSKGNLAHFKSAFPDDPSLARLAEAGRSGG